LPPAAALRRERAVLVGLCKERRHLPEVEEHLEELGLLADTAGAVVVGRVVQDRGPATAATLVRRGKVEEIEALARERQADLVVFDEDLSPAQIKNLSKAVPAKILDRSTLILDIFARRARSREARTQVELAQLRYLLPRLAGQWAHLSRQQGGIGQRGVGETQLEIDRRFVRHRIGRLSADLKAIEKNRDERRKGRSSEQRVALIGYTNAGKSTLLNLMTGAGAFVEDRLFATLDPLVRRCERGGRPPFLLIDTVGFIRKLPHHLVASFRSTLEEAADAHLLLHVVDASSAALEEQMRTTRATLEDLRLADRPCLVVFNKIDLASPETLERLRDQHPGAVFIAALDPAQADRLEQRVRSALGEPLVEGTVSIPADAPALLARLCAAVRVVHSALIDGHLEIRFQARPSDMARVSRLLRAEEGPVPLQGGKGA
jgi:GTP-binding protein HflX